MQGSVYVWLLECSQNKIHRVVQRIQYVCVKNVMNIACGLEVLLMQSELFISSYSHALRLPSRYSLWVQFSL